MLACSPMPSKRTVSVFVGGSVGTDPFSPKTWSGVAMHWLTAMKDCGLLDSAHGIAVPRALHYVTLAKNYNPDRTVWRKHFYFDPAYRRALTRAAKKIPVTSPVLMQVGHMFSLPAA